MISKAFTYFCVHFPILSVWTGDVSSRHLHETSSRCEVGPDLKFLWSASESSQEWRHVRPRHELVILNHHNIARIKIEPDIFNLQTLLFSPPDTIFVLNCIFMWDITLKADALWNNLKNDERNQIIFVLRKLPPDKLTVWLPRLQSPATCIQHLWSR